MEYQRPSWVLTRKHISAHTQGKYPMGISPLTGWEEQRRSLKALAALADSPGMVPSIHMVAHKSFDILGHEACKWCTEIDAGQTLLHIK